MKNKVVLWFLTAFILASSFGSAIAVEAVEMVDLSPGDVKNQHMVTSPGLFSGYNVVTKECLGQWLIDLKKPEEDPVSNKLGSITSAPMPGSGGEAKVEDAPKQEEQSNSYAARAGRWVGKMTQKANGFKNTVTDVPGTVSDGMANMGGRVLTDTARTIFDDVLAPFMDYNCGGEGDWGFISQLTVILKQVNFTQSKAIMGMVALMQYLALSLGLFIIIYYGISMVGGIQQTPPMAFAIRMTLAMMAVYFAPWLLQDILNINNIIVHLISKINGYSAIPIEFQFPLTVLMLYINLGTASVAGIAGLFLVAIAIIFSLIPLFKVVLWWYLRWMKLMVYFVISPLMFLAIALPETSRTASNFIRTFFNEAFTQTFMVIAVFLVVKIMPELVDLMFTYRLGVIGVAIALYAMLSFLSQVPKIPYQLIEGRAFDFNMLPMKLNGVPKGTKKLFKSQNGGKGGRGRNGGSGSGGKSDGGAGGAAKGAAKGAAASRTIKITSPQKVLKIKKP